MDGKFGYSTLPQVAYWNCTCEVVRGSPLLLALLAAAVAGGGSLLSAGLIIWAMSGWVCLSHEVPLQADGVRQIAVPIRNEPA